MTADAGGQVAAPGGGTSTGARGGRAAREPGRGAPGSRAPGDSRRDVRASERGDLARAVPAVPRAGRGSRIWDVDGREYLDFVCSFGPIVLGHAHPAVEAAVERQRGLADCQNGPSPRMVELAERLVDLVPHADWAMFAKNGTDATTLALSIARAATGRRKVLVAARRVSRLGALVHAEAGRDHAGGPRAPHPVRLQRPRQRRGRRRSGGQATWPASWSPRSGTTRGSTRRNAIRPSRGASGRLCDRRGAVLPSTTCARGFRLHLGGSWEPLRRPAGPLRVQQGDRERLSARGGGRERFPAGRRPAGVRHGLASGSPPFRWRPRSRRSRRFETERGIERMARAGHAPPGGLGPAGPSPRAPDHAERAGPAAVPDLRRPTWRRATFDRANVFTGEAARLGVWLHPWHNWFLSAAHTDAGRGRRARPD